MKKILGKEAIIGITVLLSICFIYWGIEFLKGVDLFTPSNTYVAKFDHTEGLVVNAPVTVNGFKVGQVRSLNYDFNSNKVAATVFLDKNMKLPKGTVIELDMALLGTASLVINLGNESGYYKPGDEVPTSIKTGIMDAVGSSVPSIQNMIPKLDSILVNINRLLANPALSASVTRLDGITANLESTSKQLDQLMKTLPPVMKNVNSITTKLDSSSSDLNGITNKLNNLPIDQTYANIDETIKNVKQLSESLHNRDSSLGMLIYDPTLYNNLTHSVASLDSLLNDVKKNPRKYINLKIF